jgi:anti-anti-sigma factor
VTISDVSVNERGDGTAVVRFIGEHDLTQREATQQLLARRVAGNEVVTVDLREMTFIDSAFMHCLVIAHKQANARGSRFRVQLGAGSAIERALSVSGLLETLEHFHDDDDTLPPVPLPDDFSKAVSA